MEVYFKDAEGNAVTLINKDNLDDFKKFLQTVDYRDKIDTRPNSSSLRLSEDISFDELTKNENGTELHFPENVQKALGEIMYYSSPSQDRALEAIDAADAYPKIISTMHLRAGTSTGGTLYDFIRDTIAKRPLSENLAVIDALVTDTHGFEIYKLGQPDKAVKSLSGNQKKHLEHIFSLGKQLASAHSQEQYKYYPARQAISQIARKDTFINANLSKEMRDTFNDEYFGSTSRADSKLLFQRVNTLDKKHFRAEDIAFIVGSRAYSVSPRTNKDTSDAKTQAEKNVNIIPEHYQKVKELIMELAEKENAYIPGTRGETKSLVQKVQDLAVKLYNIEYDRCIKQNLYVSGGKVSDWKSLPRDFKSGIINDVLLDAAQKEIINGNVAKLDKETLQMVLNNDKDAYYSKMLPEDIAKTVQLSRRQEVKRMVRQVKNTSYINVYDADLSTKEKVEMVDNVEKALQPEFERKQQLEQVKEEYQSRMTEVQQAYQEFSKAYDTTSRIANLQKAYQNIVACFKNGEPNKHEACLTQQEVEKVISSVLDGQHAFVDTPDQGSLPIFGRGNEKERRSALSSAIRAFNNELSRQKDDIKAFSGRLLTPEALQEAEQNKASLEQKYKTVEKQWQNDLSWKYSNYSQDMKDLEKINCDERIIKESREIIQQHLAGVRKKAKNAVGVPETSPLQAVRADMDKDTKAAVRRKNKTVTDKLAARAAQKNKKESSR